MYIKNLKLRNIKGVEYIELEFPAGSVTIIAGDNGVGKTSILAALLYTDENGHNPDMIRNFRKGAEYAEIMILIGDEGGEYEGAFIMCQIYPTETKRTVRHPKRGKLGVAESKRIIQSLMSMIALDPISIEAAKPADQIKLFLEALPIKLAPDQLSFMPGDDLKGVDYSKHALEVLGNEKIGLMGMLYDRRKIKTAIAKDKRASARVIEAGLPQNPPEGDWAAVLQQKETELEALKNEAVEAAKIIKETTESNMKDIDWKTDESIEKILQERDEAIGRIRADVENRIAAANVSRKERSAQLIGSRDAALTEGNEIYTPKHTVLVTEAEQARIMLEQHLRTVSARDQVTKQYSEATAIEVENESITRQIDRLKELKGELLGTLPIAGVEIIDGQIYDNGLPLSEVNSAERYRLYFEISKMKMGPLAIMVMDDAEKFGPSNKQLIIDSAKAAGIQVLMAIRTEGLLHVETQALEGK